MTRIAVRVGFLALFISMVLPIVGAAPAQGQTIIAQWNFDTGDPAGNGNNRTGPGYEAQTVDPNASALDISLSDSIPNTGESWIEYASPAYPTLVLRIPPGGNSRSPAEAILNNRYIEFSIYANPGFAINLDTLTFDTARGGGGIRGWALVSLDATGLGTYINDEDVPLPRPRLTNVTVDLSGLARNLTQITLRLYTWVPGSGQSLEYDNITVNGIVQ
jgi:hypothetical protein